MADPIVVKVSELTELTDLATGDLVTVVDVSEAVSANKTKKLQAGNIKLFTSAQLTDSIVTASKLANDAVETVAIKDANVTTAKLATGAVTATQIADTTITGGKLVNGTITATQIANNTITGAKLVNKTITAAQIADNTITAAQIATGGIATEKLANEAVTEAKLGAIKRTVAIPVFGFEDNVIVKNFTNLFSFPPMLNGHVITSVSATLLGAVSVSGALTIKLINGLNEMASVTINQNAWSGTATPNTSYDDVASFGKFSVNVTGAGSGAKGLTVYLEVTG